MSAIYECGHSLSWHQQLGCELVGIDLFWIGSTRSHRAAPIYIAPFVVWGTGRDSLDVVADLMGAREALPLVVVADVDVDLGVLLGSLREHPGHVWFEWNALDVEPKPLRDHERIDR
jgi:hypothetical protein